MGRCLRDAILERCLRKVLFLGGALERCHFTGMPQEGVISNKCLGEEPFQRNAPGRNHFREVPQVGGHFKETSWRGALLMPMPYDRWPSRTVEQKITPTIIVGHWTMFD